MRFRKAKRANSHIQAPPWRIGVLGVIGMLIIAAFVFTKKIPFTHDFRVEATVTTQTGLRKGSPVRVAGVDVGRVTGFERGPGNTRVVKMELTDKGLPLHRDATLRIRPRLFLEGGFYVDLSPGSPSGPVMDEGSRLPLGQTAVPVQFSQALGTLDVNGRDSLKGIIAELDTTLKDGGEADFAAAQKPLGRALRDGAIVGRAARGTQEHDLSETIQGAAKVTAALAGKADQLGGALDAGATTMEALAAEETGLRASLRGLDGVVQDVPGRLRTIAGDTSDGARLLGLLRPGVRQVGRSAPGLTRTLRELQNASKPAELPGLLKDLRPTLAVLPPLADSLTGLLPQVTPVTECLIQRAIPVLNSKLDDGALSTGRTVWQEAAATLPGLAGASGSFDAEGAWVRYNSSVGDSTVSTGVVPALGSALTAATNSPPIGSRPTWLGNGNLPPFRPDVACAANAAPDLTARTGGGSPMQRTGKTRSITTSAAQWRRMLADPAKYKLRSAPPVRAK